MAIEKFRHFATEHNVHITLVVHPRKEDESSKLSISSFYGSAKATQEADTVIILQNDNARRKYVDVRKNRFDGTLGTSPLYFQSKNGRYVEDEGVQSRAMSSSTSTIRTYQTSETPPTICQSQETFDERDVDNHWNPLSTGEKLPKAPN